MSGASVGGTTQTVRALGWVAALLLAGPSIARADCSQAAAKAAKSIRSAFSGDHASALVTRDDDVLVEEGIGGADSRSPFLLASVSKPFTSALVLRQIEQGTMSLEDTVAEDLPPSFLAGTGPDWKKIRVRHLLEHGSGIRDYINSAPSSAYLETPRSFEELLSTVPFKLGFQPGMKLDYSNTGYLILGRILEARTGKPYSKLFASLAKTLGLLDSGLVYGPLAGVYGGTGVHPANMEAVGNAYSSARDLLRFLRALDGDELLSPATIARMLTPDPECAGGDQCDKYGLAFTLKWKEIEGRDWYLKTGHLKNVATVIAKLPVGRLNVAIVSDRAGKDTEAVAKAALRTLVAGGCAPAQ